MNLDVGCGARFRASVRLDIDRTKSANILGSVHCLPFRDDSFEFVYCFHILEHVDFPKLALKELVRVGRLVRVRLPFLFYHHKKRLDFRVLGLEWCYRLDMERKRFGVPFRIEVCGCV